MNIFFTDPCPYKCAKYLDNKRVIKMCLETAQMLSTAINEHNGISPYKSTHVNHPSNKWARESRSNYIWLLSHFEALCHEYTYRYGKVHKCQQYFDMFFEGVKCIPEKGMTEKPNCAANKNVGVSYKHISDIYTAYKLYLNDRWDTDKREPSWDCKEAS